MVKAEHKKAMVAMIERAVRLGQALRKLKLRISPKLTIAASKDGVVGQVLDGLIAFWTT